MASGTDCIGSGVTLSLICAALKKEILFEGVNHIEDFLEPFHMLFDI